MERIRGLLGLVWLPICLGSCILETRYQSPKILFLGNSITLSKVNPEIGWGFEGGMAASAPEKDYVHQTIRMLKEGGLEAEAVLGSRDCEICDGVIGEHLETMDEIRALRARYAVVQLGENSDAIEIRSGRLTGQYLELLTALEESGFRRIFCITNWGESSLEAPHNQAILKAIRRYPDIRVVDITAVAGESANYGDSTLYPNRDVQWHPGDGGMEGIARALSESILEAR